MTARARLAALLAALALAGPALSGGVQAAGTGTIDRAERGEVDRGIASALQSLYAKYPAAKSLGRDAKAILVFPKIVKAGLMVGGESGNGALLVKGKTVAYYNTSGVSYGMQVGVQRYGYALFLMTEDAVASLGRSEGMEIGVGPSVVVMDDGLASKTTTTTVKSDIYAFIFGQKGLMAGLGIQGSKITKLQPADSAPAR